MKRVFYYNLITLKGRLLLAASITFFLFVACMKPLHAYSVEAGMATGTDAFEMTFQTGGKGELRGRIFDADNGEPLIGAVVRVENNTSLGSVTDHNGSYRIQNIPAGDHKILISYLGYESTERDVLIEANKPTTLTLRLISTTSSMEEVTIVAFRKGQSRSMNVQKEAPNLKTIVSYEQIERFPDLNIAESIKRVPGVVTEPDRGEAESVKVRGLPSGMHTVTLNGQRMSATGNDRETDTRIIPTGMISSMELIKSPTADMDADATSGSINLITTRPVGDEVMLKGQVGTGYNAMSGRPQWLGSLTYSKRVGKLDFVVSGNYQKDNRATEDIRHDWDVRSFGNGPQDVLAGLRPSEYHTERRRIGIGTQLDYLFNDRSSVYFRAVYNNFDEYELRNDARHGLDNGTYIAPGMVERARFEKVLREYNRITNLVNLNAGGKHDIGKATLDYNVGYSRGTFNVPLREYYAFRHTGRPDYKYDITDRSYASLEVTNGVDLNNPSDMRFRYYENRRDDITDTDKFATINLEVPYYLGAGKGKLKVGGKAWQKTKERIMEENRWTSYSGDLSMAQFFQPNDKSLVGGRYPIFGQIDWEQGKRFFNENYANFGLDEARSRLNSDPNNYYAVENIFATYAMTDLKFGNLNINAGLRGEQVNNSYRGNEVTFNESGVYESTTPVQVDDISYFNLFPMMNMKFEINRMSNIRFAYTQTIVRPDFTDLVPYRLINEDNQIINTGNPYLRPSTAHNVDISYENYFQSVGMLSIGGFYKNFDDFIYNELTVVQDGSIFNGYQLISPENGESAFTLGVEVAWQQKLDFLPGFMKNFGIFANYTFAYSEAEIEVPEDRVIMLPMQPRHIMNIALQYDKGGFSAQLSYNWRDTWLHEVGFWADMPTLNPNQQVYNDRFFKSIGQLDFSASQRISKNFSTFVNLNNLTNTSHIHYFTNPIYPYRNSVHGWWGMLGLRYNL